MTPAPIDRSAVVAAAAAHDINNDLSIAMSAISDVLNGNAPRSELRDAMAACQRMAWVSGLLVDWAAKRHIPPSAVNVYEIVNQYRMGLQ